MTIISGIFGGPSLEAFVRRARKKLAIGDFERAQGVVTDGLRSFPDAEPLRDLELTIRRAQARAGIRSLRARIEREEDPRAYEELIALYLELGMLAEARREALEYVGVHPDRDTPHLLLGEMSLQAFLDDLQARDAHIAHKRLRRAAALNQQAIKPRILLGELYWCVGADHALGVVGRELQAFAESDESLEPVLEHLQDIDPSEKPEPLDGIFERVEVSGDLVREPGTWPLHRRSATAQLDEERAQRVAESILKRGAATEIVLLKRNGRVLGHARTADDESDAPKRDLTGVARAVARTVSHYARDLDLGAFKRCTIQSPGGHVAVGEISGVVAGARWGRGGEAQRLWERITLEYEGVRGGGE